jgi:hypothetical protein
MCATPQSDVAPGPTRDPGADVSLTSDLNGGVARAAKRNHAAMVQQASVAMYIRTDECLGLKVTRS